MQQRNPNRSIELWICLVCVWLGVYLLLAGPMLALAKYSPSRYVPRPVIRVLYAPVNFACDSHPALGRLRYESITLFRSVFDG